MAVRALTNAVLRNHVTAQRLSASEQRKIDDFLRLIASDIRQQLDRGDLTAYSEDKLRKILDRLQSQIGGRLVDFRHEVLNDAYTIALQQAAKQKADLSIAVGQEFTSPTASQLTAALLSDPLHVKGTAGGKLLSDFIDDWTHQETARVTNAIRLGVAQGETNSQIVARLIGTAWANYNDGILAITKRSADVVVNTAVQHVAQVARSTLFAANEDIVDGEQWVATLDNATCLQCAALDGQEFKLDEGPRPPAHINCRCTTVPIVAGPIGKMEGGTRPAVGDQGVEQIPAGQTYFEWLKEQPAEFQDYALGPVRGQLLREGGLSAEKFQRLMLDKRFEPLTLHEAELTAPMAFARAGLETSAKATFTVMPDGTYEFGTGQPIDEGATFYHGTSSNQLDPDNNDLIWFTDSKRLADQYRLRSIYNNADIPESYLPEDVSGADELGETGIKAVMDEAGIPYKNVGQIIPSKLFAKSLFEADNNIDGLRGGNVADVEEAWASLNKLGIVDEPWSAIDPEIQQELRDDFEGKAAWRFLEENNIYAWLKSHGYDAVKITDVDMNGNAHDAIAMLGGEPPPRAVSIAPAMARQYGSDVRAEYKTAIEETCKKLGFNSDQITLTPGAYSTNIAGEAMPDGRIFLYAHGIRGPENVDIILSHEIQHVVDQQVFDEYDQEILNQKGGKPIGPVYTALHKFINDPKIIEQLDATGPLVSNYAGQYWDLYESGKKIGKPTSRSAAEAAAVAAVNTDARQRAVDETLAEIASRFIQEGNLEGIPQVWRDFFLAIQGVVP